MRGGVSFVMAIEKEGKPEAVRQRRDWRLRLLRDELAKWSLSDLRTLRACLIAGSAEGHAACATKEGILFDILSVVEDPSVLQSAMKALRSGRGRRPR